MGMLYFLLFVAGVGALILLGMWVLKKTWAEQEQARLKKKEKRARSKRMQTQVEQLKRGDKLWYTHRPTSRRHVVTAAGAASEAGTGEKYERDGTGHADPRRVKGSARRGRDKQSADDFKMSSVDFVGDKQAVH